MCSLRLFVGDASPLLLPFSLQFPRHVTLRQCEYGNKRNTVIGGEFRECSFLWFPFSRIIHIFVTEFCEMSVLGIDFGSDACVIGQAGGMGAGVGRGGIDIVLNDNSKRRTPWAVWGVHNCVDRLCLSKVKSVSLASTRKRW